MHKINVKGGSWMSGFCFSSYTDEGFKCFKLNSINPDCFRYILKGRPDSIKQKIFTSVVEKLEKDRCNYALGMNYNGKISGILCEEKNFIVCDGTYPFNENSKTYGANDCEINFSMLQNNKILRDYADSIREINKSIQTQENRCLRFMSAAKCLWEERLLFEKDIVDTRKVNRYANRLWSSKGGYPNGKVGCEKRVFMSVPTESGVSGLNTDFSVFCDTAILLVDPVGNVSQMIIDRIRRYALSSGTDIICATSFLAPDENLQHIIIPSMRFGVFTNSKELKLNIHNIKKVHSTRFLIGKHSENTKVRLQFNQKANDALIKEVSNSIKKINEYTEKLNEYYEQATDEKSIADYTVNRIV